MVLIAALAVGTPGCSKKKPASGTDSDGGGPYYALVPMRQDWEPPQGYLQDQTAATIEHALRLAYGLVECDDAQSILALEDNAARPNMVVRQKSKVLVGPRGSREELVDCKIVGNELVGPGAFAALTGAAAKDQGTFDMQQALWLGARGNGDQLSYGALSPSFYTFAAESFGAVAFPNKRNVARLVGNMDDRFEPCQAQVLKHPFEKGSATGCRGGRYRLFSKDPDAASAFAARVAELNDGYLAALAKKDPLAARGLGVALRVDATVDDLAGNAKATLKRGASLKTASAPKSLSSIRADNAKIAAPVKLVSKMAPALQGSFGIVLGPRMSNVIDASNPRKLAVPPAPKKLKEKRKTAKTKTKSKGVGLALLQDEEQPYVPPSEPPPETGSDFPTGGTTDDTSWLPQDGSTGNDTSVNWPTGDSTGDSGTGTDTSWWPQGDDTTADTTVPGAESGWPEGGDDDYTGWDDLASGDDQVSDADVAGVDDFDWFGDDEGTELTSVTGDEGDDDASTYQLTDEGDGDEALEVADQNGNEFTAADDDETPAGEGDDEPGAGGSGTSTGTNRNGTRGGERTIVGPDGRTYSSNNPMGLLRNGVGVATNRDTAYVLGQNDCINRCLQAGRTLEQAFPGSRSYGLSIGQSDGNGGIAANTGHRMTGWESPPDANGNRQAYVLDVQSGRQIPVDSLRGSDGHYSAQTTAAMETIMRENYGGNSSTVYDTYSRQGSSPTSISDTGAGWPNYGRSPTTGSAYNNFTAGLNNGTWQVQPYTGSTTNTAPEPRPDPVNVVRFANASSGTPVDPVTPSPVTPNPVTPNPVTPNPVTPNPVTPNPVVPIVTGTGGSATVNSGALMGGSGMSAGMGIPVVGGGGMIGGNGGTGLTSDGVPNSILGGGTAATATPPVGSGPSATCVKRGGRFFLGCWCSLKLMNPAKQVCANGQLVNP